MPHTLAYASSASSAARAAPAPQKIGTVMIPYRCLAVYLPAVGVRSVTRLSPLSAIRSPVDEKEALVRRRRPDARWIAVVRCLHEMVAEHAAVATGVPAVRG